MTEYIPIRKFGRYSLYVRLPAEFVHANGLSPGDFVLLEPEKLKIVKQADVDAVAGPKRVLVLLLKQMKTINIPKVLSGMAIGLGQKVGEQRNLKNIVR
jgi:hypothetical protein